VGNESEVTLSLSLEDNLSPALAVVEAGYLAALDTLEAATTAAAAQLTAAWQAPLTALAQGSQEALAWLSALGSELQALGSLNVSPTVTINDLASGQLQAIRAEISALAGEITVSTSSYGAAAIDRQVVRTVIVPELNRLGYRA
jgi:hypothetical protein